MKRLAILLPLLPLLLLIGCGSGGSTPTAITVPAPPAAACPQAAAGQGSMGACAPPSVGLSNGKSITFQGPITYPDLSNNNPVTDSQMRSISRGHDAIYLKTNQGTGFVDQTFARMAHSARRHGMAAGGYDFVSCYCAAEARLMVKVLHAAGQTRAARRWLPPTLDVEYGSASRSGVRSMVRILRAAFGRVNIYTGAWYWTPRLGCFWPKRVSSWLSGYPHASVVCGLHPRLYTQHQYTDRGYNGATTSDMSVWRGSAASFKRFARFPAHHKPKPKPKPIPVPKPHRHVTAADRLACKHLQYDRKKHYRRVAHRGWRALHDRGVACSLRHGAYLIKEKS